MVDRILFQSQQGQGEQKVLSSRSWLPQRSWRALFVSTLVPQTFAALTAKSSAQVAGSMFVWCVCCAVPLVITLESEFTCQDFCEALCCHSPEAPASVSEVSRGHARILASIIKICVSVAYDVHTITRSLGGSFLRVPVLEWHALCLVLPFPRPHFFTVPSQSGHCSTVVTVLERDQIDCLTPRVA